VIKLRNEPEYLTFIARIQTQNRVWIPKRVREVLDLNEGDYVEVKIRKIEKMKPLRE